MANDLKLLEKMVLGVINALECSGDCDPHWLAIARTNLENGFKALNQAVLEPVSEVDEREAYRQVLIDRAALETNEQKVGRKNWLYELFPGGVSARTMLILLRSGVSSIEELRKLGTRGLLKTQGCGTKSLNEIEDGIGEKLP